MNSGTVARRFPLSAPPKPPHCILAPPAPFPHTSAFPHMKAFLTLLAALAMLASTTFAADGPVRHVVAFKFKSGADPAKIKSVEAGFAALKQKISLIQSLEYGTNSSPEDRAHGYTHLWIVTFKTAADRDAYIVHPEHKAFVGTLQDVLDEAFVFDFVPKE